MLKKGRSFSISLHIFKLRVRLRNEWVYKYTFLALYYQQVWQKMFYIYIMFYIWCVDTEVYNYKCNEQWINGALQLKHRPTFSSFTLEHK